MQTAEQAPPPVVGPSDGESQSTLQPVEAAEPAPAQHHAAEDAPAAAVAAEEHTQPNMNGMELTNGVGAAHGVEPAEGVVSEAAKGSEDTNPDMMLETERSSARKRVPTAAAAAAGEQAEAEAMARGKPRRKKAIDDGSVSRTTHGGVKIGGRAVTWVGGAGLSREVLDKMGIPQLRAVFLKTFMHPTGSNNAEWLRKKLAQPPDPNVGAARAAVPRARDVTAEIWTTGTQFKGFTKQERFRLQQMGGNCEAKVVEVVGSDDDGMPKSKKKSYGKGQVELHTMQVIGNEKFEMPPPKRLRGGPLAHNPDMTGVKGLSFDGSDIAGGPPVSMGPMYDPADGTIQPAHPGEPSIMATQWRNLQYDERHLLQAGMNVKVYRADENWHHGSLHKVSYVGPEDDLRMCVTIYYWEHDQSETRDIAEFFRGDSTSLIQWQAPANPEAMMFQAAQSHTGEEAAMGSKPNSSSPGALRGQK